MDSFIAHKETTSSANTIKSYKNVLTNATKAVTDIFNQDKLIEYINTLENPNTKLMTQKVLHNFLKFNDKPCDKLFAIKNDLNEKLKAVVKEPKSKLSSDEMLEIVSKIPTDTFTNTLEKTLLYILLKESEQLRSDIAYVKYKNFNRDVDSYLQDGIFYFNNTKKLNGKFQITLSPESNELVNKLLSFDEIKKFDLVFPILTRRKNELYKDLSDGLRNFLYVITKNHFNTKFSMNEFRSILGTSTTDVVEDKIKTGEITLKEGIQEVIQQAKNQNHSIETHLQFYVRDRKQDTTDSISSFSSNETDISAAIYDDNWDIPKDIKLDEIKDDKKKDELEELNTFIINGIELKAAKGTKIYVNGLSFQF